MKLALTFLFFFLLSNVQAQNGASFLRLYDSDGKKMAKGEILETTDTTIVLLKGIKYTAIPVTQIEVIKSRRTTAHRVGITTLKVVGAAVLLAGAIYSLSQPKYTPYTIDTKPKKKAVKSGKVKVEKYAKPPRKYKIDNSLKTWQYERRNLNELL